MKYVGTKEAAEILGVKRPVVTRLQARGAMPQTAIRAPWLDVDGEQQDLAATSIWRRADVLRFALNRKGYARRRSTARSASGSRRRPA